MLSRIQILVRPIALTVLTAASGLALSGCGQRGPLVFPQEAAAQGRATLPQTLIPDSLLPERRPSNTVPPTAPRTQLPADAMSAPTSPAAATP